MTFSASSYFAGVATVLATVLLGFGGGVLMTDSLVGNSDPRGASRVAQRVAETNPTPPAVVTSQVAPAQDPRAALPPEAPTVQVAVPAPPAPAQSTAPLVVMQEKPAPQVAMEQSQKTDVKKALAAEKRKQERREWAERRKQKIEELNAVSESAKDAERNREPMMRSYAAQSQPQPFSVFRLD